MKMFVGLLGRWLACFLFAIASVDAAVNDVCLTSESLSGTCIPLAQCQRLYDLYSQPSPHPIKTTQLLSAEECGVQLVCCRDETHAPTTGTPCGDASCHRNVGLINPEFCGQTIAGRIIDGNETGVFEMPWLTLLKYRSKKGNETEERFRCGGSLINERYVLTAAHCIANSTRIRLLSVRLGDHDITTNDDCEDQAGTIVCAPPPQNIDVESFISHPRYNATTLVNDIALIRLSVPADTSKDTINPICLPVGFDAEHKNLDNLNMIVAGWGILISGLPSPDVLKASLQVMPTVMCRTVFQPFDIEVSSNQLCAGGTNTNWTQDSCRVWSGAPLISSGIVNGEEGFVQYGVLSFGHKRCGFEGVPDVYTRIAPYINWILDNMKP